MINQGPSNLLTSQKKDQMQKKDASESSDREKIQDLRPDQTGINIDLYNNMKKSRLHELTAKYVRGKGIQVGPVYHELGITSNIDITYLNHTGQEQISQEQPEPENSVPAKPDKVIDIGCLDKYENEELNFCIVNKVTEKVKDPLEFLNCALRTLKPGGILFLIDSNNADSPETSDEKEEKTLSKEYPTEAILKQLNLQEPDLFTVLEDVEYNFEHEKKEAQEHVFIVEKGHFEKEITRLLKTSDGIINSKDIELDVIVPVYNAYEDTLKCLYSVLKNAGNFRTVLINDKSTDHRIKDLFTKLKPFESEKFKKKCYPFKQRYNCYRRVDTEVKEMCVF
ncbi:glycosyltransferase [Methanosarcina mazei]|nr:glycosyltransferase [Methanosarcina mazei]